MRQDLVHVSQKTRNPLRSREQCEQFMCRPPNIPKERTSIFNNRIDPIIFCRDKFTFEWRWQGSERVWRSTSDSQNAEAKCVGS